MLSTRLKILSVHKRDLNVNNIDNVVKSDNEKKFVGHVMRHFVNFEF